MVVRKWHRRLPRRGATVISVRTQSTMPPRKHRDILKFVSQSLKKRFHGPGSLTAQKIAEARSYGDLSENAEYDAAKEAQGHLEIRIAKLEETLSRARIIDSAEDCRGAELR